MENLPSKNITLLGVLLNTKYQRARNQYSTRTVRYLFFHLALPLFLFECLINISERVSASRKRRRSGVHMGR